MAIHRIVIERSPRGWRCFSADGQSLGVVASPVYGTARLLIERGIAKPTDTLEVTVVKAGRQEVIGRTNMGAGARLAMQNG